jgi:hypothetical protein
MRSRRRLPTAVAALLLALASGCGGERPPAPADRERPPAPSPADSAPAAPEAADTVAAPRFERWPVSGARALAALVDSLGPERWTQVLAINRVDAAHVRDRDTLVVPDRFGDSLAFAPFPRAWSEIADSGRVVFVSRRVQAFAAYDSGRLARWGPVSTGRRSKPTPAGLYHATWKSRQRVSTVDDEWLLRWCVNIENREGVSLHQYELPGRPASHSCVRLAEHDAIWNYAFCEQWRLAPDDRAVERTGTPVVVFGEWAWGARAPWKRLPEDASATTLASHELEEALRTWREAVRPEFGAPARAVRAAGAKPAARDTVEGSGQR